MSHSSFTALQHLAPRTPQAVREHEILRLAATLGGGDGEKSAPAARREILNWAEKRTGGSLPPEAWEHDEFEHRAGGRDCTAVRITDDARDIWAIRADDPDKNVAGRVWTTEAIVGHPPGEIALLSVRLLVSSPEKEMHIEPAVPGLVQQLASECGLYHQNRRLDTDPWLIESEDDVERLIDTLIDPKRQIPLFVLTVPAKKDGPVRPLIDPVPIARATLGIAMTVVLPARFTWTLTDRFGKQLSVFGGAVRVYLPGFTEDADPYGGHDLVLADRLATEEDASRTSTRLRQIAGAESLRQLRLGRNVLSYAVVRARNLELKRRRLEQEEASDADRLSAAQVQIARLKEDLDKERDDQQLLWDENEAVEERAQFAEARLKNATYQIQQLLHQIKTRDKNPDENISIPTTWKEFSDWCDKNLIGRVLLLPRARREVKAAKFKNIAAAARCLLWLANDYRERRLGNGDGDGDGDGDLRISIESGIQNKPCGGDSFQIKWQGRHVDVEWHIKNGGNTHDPDRCLRIYYFWDDLTQQIVIASMPAHIPTDVT